MTEISDAALIERYLQLREYIERETAQHDDRMKPYQDGMNAIEAEFMRRFAERVPDLKSRANAACETGTAFRVRKMTRKVVDQSSFLQFCFDHWEEGGSEMLNVGVLAKPLDEWLGKDGHQLPAGLELDHKISVNIRKV